MTTQTQPLFMTVSRDDPLAFGTGPDFNPKKVADWIRLDRDDVSKIASVSKSSVRWDADVPIAVRERLEDIANIANMVAGIFGGDVAKTAVWFRAKNPMLGDVSPRDMLRLGKYDRLRKFIVGAIADRVADQKATSRAAET